MDEARIYDVAIVGGGLAGLSLAIQCAEKNYAVALFEKEEYPFHKVCGEYISMESWAFLERLGIELRHMNLPLIKKLAISDPFGSIYNFDLSPGGFGISRYLLDNTLYKIAKQKGVKVFTNTKVNEVSFATDQFRIATQNLNILAKVVAGSFGKRSNLDVKMKRSFVLKKPGKLNNYVGIKYHVRSSQPLDTIALHNFKDGYCGISKIEDDIYCLCYLTTAQNLRLHNNSVAQMEQNVLWKNPRLKNIFTTASFLYEQPLAISQISFNKKSQVEDHIIMMGDAAGMITPLCGNGMSMAMHSSKIAFENIHNFLQNKISRGDMEDAYSKTWKKQFSKRLLTGRIVQRLFGGKYTTALFLKIMKALPAAANAIIRSTHGEAF